MDTTELKELMQQRAFAYQFLSRAYLAAPDSAFIDVLLDTPETKEMLPEFEAEAHDADREVLRKDLAADYNQLFLGMSPHPVAPYESVYTSDEGLLMQEARDEMVALYNQYGLSVDKAFDLPEDHLGLEFELAAHLATRSLEALEAHNDEEAQQLAADLDEFVREHLSWVDAFSADVQKHAHTAFYYNLADLTRQAVAA